MEAAGDDITHRISRLREMSISSLVATHSGGSADSERRIMIDRIMSTMGDAAPFIESLEIEPMPPKPGDAPKQPAMPRPRRGGGFRQPPSPPPPPAAWVYRFETPAATVAGDAAEIQRKALEMAAEAHRRAQAAQVELNKGHADAERLRAQTAGSRGRELELKLRQKFGTDILQGGAVVAKVRAQVRARQLLRNVLSRSRRGPAEIPFALDADGKLHADPADLPKLEQLQLEATAGSASKTPPAANWVVATRKDEASGLTF